MGRIRNFLLVAGAIACSLTAFAVRADETWAYSVRGFSGIIIDSHGGPYEYTAVGLSAYVPELIVGNPPWANELNRQVHVCAGVHIQNGPNQEQEDQGCGPIEVIVDPALGDGRALGSIPSDRGTIAVNIRITAIVDRPPRISPSVIGPPLIPVVVLIVEERRDGDLSGTITSSAIGGNRDTPWSSQNGNLWRKSASWIPLPQN